MYSFETFSGHIDIRHELCKSCQGKVCVQACKYGILKLEEGLPKLQVEEAGQKKGSAWSA